MSKNNRSDQRPIEREPSTDSHLKPVASPSVPRIVKDGLESPRSNLC
jgi:hypothetical protein